MVSRISNYIRWSSDRQLLIFPPLIARSLAAAFLLAALLHPQPGVSSTMSAQQVVSIAKKLELLQKYLTAPIAKKIADGDNITAKMLLQRADKKAEQASTSFRNGDLPLTATQTDEGLKIFAEAMAVNRSADSGKSSFISENKSILDEIDTYHRAYDEALKAKGPAAAGLLNRGKFNELLEKSKKIAQAGDPGGAQQSLKEAYNMIITALSRVRENETVVYDLDFRTPADEYRYEYNRYQSYQMLVVQQEMDGGVSESAVELSKRYSAKGQETYKIAEHQASLGDYISAIKSMEDANKSQVRALRAMGMSIPN